MQLLAPRPFLHGAARVALAVSGTAIETTADEGVKHTLHIDASEACGGPLLPDALPQLCALLQESQQGGDFEIRCSNADSRHFDWLNVPPPVLPLLERAQRRQPLAKLPVHEAITAEAAREAYPAATSGGGREHSLPATVSHVRCTVGAAAQSSTPFPARAAVSQLKRGALLCRGDRCACSTSRDECWLLVARRGTHEALNTPDL